MQSKAMSLAEATANTVVSFLVSVAVNFYCLPLLGLNPSIGQSIAMTVLFSVISIVRGYYLRRFFEWLNALKAELIEMKELT
jgi:uncharacterized membrane protein YwzB